MASDSFYVVLPSNTPEDGNSSSRFIVRLPNTLDLDANWTVSLSSIIFPTSFVSFGESGDEERAQFIKIFFTRRNRPVVAYIPSITYTSITELEDAVNSCIRGAVAAERLAKTRNESRSRKSRMAAAQDILTGDAPLYPKRKGPRDQEDQQPSAPPIKGFFERANLVPDPKTNAEKLSMIREMLASNKISMDETRASRDEVRERRNEVNKGWDSDKIHHRNAQKRVKDAKEKRKELAKMQASEEKERLESQQLEYQKREEREEELIKKRLVDWKEKWTFLKNKDDQYLHMLGQLSREKRNMEKEIERINAVETEETSPVTTPAPVTTPITPAPALELPTTKTPAPEPTTSSILEPVTPTLETATTTTEDPAPPQDEEPVEVIVETVDPPRQTVEFHEQLYHDEFGNLIAQASQTNPKAEATREWFEHSRKLQPPDFVESVIGIQGAKAGDEGFEQRGEKTGHKRMEKKLAEHPHLAGSHSIVLREAVNMRREEERKRWLTDHRFRYHMEAVDRAAEISIDEEPVRFIYDRFQQRFFAYWRHPDVSRVEMSPGLAYTMGFELGANGRVDRYASAKYMPNITGGHRQLYVYAPKLVEDTIVGNSTIPLLRIVNVQSEPGKVQESIYNPEHNHKLAIKRINSIAIEIRSSTGRLVNFHWGNTIVTLHFKRSLFV